MEIDKAKAAISELMAIFDHASFRGEPGADAPDVVKAARALAAATGELVVASSTTQDELVRACSSASESLRSLLRSSKGASSLADKPQVQIQLAQATKVPKKKKKE